MCLGRERRWSMRRGEEEDMENEENEEMENEERRWRMRG